MLTSHALRDAVLIAELSRLHLDQEALSRHLLKRLIETVPWTAPCAGPCSFMRLNRFFSHYDRSRNRGRLIEDWHINRPDEATVKRWKMWANSPKNPVERQIYRHFGDANFGAALIQELFPDYSSWMERLAGHAFSTIHKSQNIAGLAYLWLRLADNDIWAFCLRRRRPDLPEGQFTTAEGDTLRQLAELLYQTRTLWYSDILRELTPEQRRVLAKISGLGGTDKEVALKLKLDIETYREHKQSIYRKLDVHSELELLTKINRLPAMPPSLFPPVPGALVMGNF